MCPPQASLVKITLRGGEICGTCQHISPYEITISGEDHTLLKQAAQAILEDHNGAVIPTEVVWRVASLYKRIAGTRSVPCKLEKCPVLLTGSCGLWKARPVTTSIPLGSSQ
jgi:hypothetical protein